MNQQYINYFQRKFVLDEALTASEDQFVCNAALSCYHAGNLGQAETWAYVLIKLGNTLARAQGFVLLGRVVDKIGRHDLAKKYFQQAISITPNLADAQHFLSSIRFRKVGNSTPRSQRRVRRYHVIKAWGCGFWSEVYHLLNQLLFCEITGRLPVIHWGANCLYGYGDNGNAYELYFKPLNNCTLSDLLRKQYSFYPPKWGPDNLTTAEINKWTGAYSRMAAVDLINRDEDITICDYYSPIYNLVTFLPVHHPLYGKDLEFIYRYLVNKYLHPRSEILRQVDEFWHKNMQGKTLIAVHIRGSDKIQEVRFLDKLVRRFHKQVSCWRALNPRAYIFLLTDSEFVLEENKRRYGSKLIYTPCCRSNDSTGIHFKQDQDKKRIGTEIIVDTYLATRCNYFIGLGDSNVSAMVLHMKDWSDGACHLEGTIMSHQINLLLYDR
ncbi:MAG: hypothetical protein ACE5EH_12815 [Gammaproteobacteria bacterium]